MTEMDIATAARELGVSERTLRRWLREGRLDAYRIGGRIRIPARAIREARAPYRPESPAGTEGRSVMRQDERLTDLQVRLRLRREAAARVMDEIAARSRPGRPDTDSAEGLIRQLRHERENRG